MKRVVFFAYYFPPLAGIASERSAAFVRHLPAHGWKPTVIAPRRGMYHRSASEDPDLETAVLRTRNPEFSRVLGGGWRKATAEDGEGREGELTPARVGRVGGGLRRLVHEALYIPDARWPWIPFAARAGRRAVGSAAGPVALLSTAVPYSAHLAAARVARRTGAPWVAEFRDPWSTAEVVQVAHSAPRRALDRAMEGRILRRATRVVVTAAATRDLLLDAFADIDPHRVAVIPNGFEPVDGPVDAPPGPDERLVLLYTGTVPDPSFLVPLFRGLALLPGSGLERVRLRVLGPGAPWRAAADEVGGDPRPWLELDGVVTPDEARRACHAASALLLPLPDRRYRMVVPGKLWEYLGARRPVVAAFPPDSEMRHELAAHGDPRWLDPYTPERVAEVVRSLLDEHGRGTLQRPTVPAGEVASLTRAARTASLARVLDDALGAPA